ncbi:MAG: family peptidase [Bacteroidetes bacterium]|nr:family peptidase [Bacteroidota bacterium]
MRKTFLLALLMPLAVYAQMTYPVARCSDQVDDYFGQKVPDPYRWLECSDSADTRQWIAAQNTLTNTYFASIPYRKAMVEQVMSACSYIHYTAPYRSREYYYYNAFSSTQDQGILYRRKGPDGPQELVVDVNKLSPDHTARIEHFTHSADDHYAAYIMSRAGSDWGEIYVMDLHTLQLLPDHIPWIKFSGIAWQGGGFYYCSYPAPLAGQELTAVNKNQKVYYHKLGAPHDSLVYSSINPNLIYTVDVSEDEQYMFLSKKDITSGGNALLYRHRDSVYFQSVERHTGLAFYDYVYSDARSAIILTGAHANNKKLMIRDFREQMDHSFIEEDPKAIIEGAKAAGGKLFVFYQRDATDHIKVFNMKGKFENEIALPGKGSVSGFDGQADDKVVYYSYTSFIQPATIYRYDIASLTSTVYHASESAFDPSAYEVKQVFYRGLDLERVPMFIVSKKGLSDKEPHPLLLMGYGGFGQTPSSYFNPMLAPFLEQGGIYAVAGIRGGGEYGGAWHRAGSGGNKMTSFMDFIYAAKYLIKHKYTDKDHLAITGASNGGLLVTACANMKPDLFKVVIPEVPVTDMLRFPAYTVGSGWMTEYGSPADPADFSLLYTYSPLHRISSTAVYPATLVLTADHDDRVVPAHSYKYISTLQHIAGPHTKAPLLIRIDTNSGHGASTIRKAIEAKADIYSFIFYNMGITPKL